MNTKHISSKISPLTLRSSGFRDAPVWFLLGNKFDLLFYVFADRQNPPNNCTLYWLNLCNFEVKKKQTNEKENGINRI